MPGTVSGALLGWVGLPIVVFVVSLGSGLVVERLTRARLADALLVPVGFCAGIAVCTLVANLDAGWRVSAAILAALAVAGLLLGRRELRRRALPGPAVVAGTIVYALYLAPVALSGEWTWLGYNFANDTAVQFTITDLLVHRGNDVPGPEAAASTYNELLRVYLATAYPLGTHAYLAALTPPLGGEIAVLYQPFLAWMAAVGAMALTQLGSRSGMPGRWAAAAGVTALAANLAYHYALQGNIKEIGMLATFLVAAAAAREVLGARERVLGHVAVLGVAAAAALSVYNAAALPWLLAVGGLAGLAVLADRRSPLRHRVRGPAAVAVLVAVAGVLALPPVLDLFTFLSVARGTLSAGSTISDTLGQLGHPLELRQLSGVWLAPDYSRPFPAGAPLADALTSVLSFAVLGLGASGLALAWRRREPAPAILWIAAVVTVLVLRPRLSPYAAGKVLAIASPAVVFAAAWAAWALTRERLTRALRAAAVTGTLGLAAAVLASDAMAFRWVRLAPTDRMRAMHDVGQRFRGQGPLLWTEQDEFAKYFVRDAQVNSPEPITPRQLQVLPAYGGYRFGFYYDLDLLVPAYVQQFPLIAMRRSPSASRPPANYRRVYRNAFYEVWRRTERPQVKEHLGLAGVAERDGYARCRDIRALARGAAPGHRLVVSRQPRVELMQTAADGVRPVHWRLSPEEGQTIPTSPGRVTQVLRVAGGTHRVWVRGSFGRAVRVLVDGRAVGEVKGINTPAQWLQAGEVDLSPGRHRVELVRGGGSVAPGDGAPPLVGPVALEPARPGRLRTLHPRQWRRLCGEPLDWIEVTDP